MDDDDLHADLSVHEQSDGSEFRLSDNSDHGAPRRKRNRRSTASRSVHGRETSGKLAGIPQYIRDRCKFDIDKLPRHSSDPILLLTGEENEQKCWTCVEKDLPCAVLSRSKSCAGCYARHTSCNANQRVPDFHDSRMRKLYEKLQEEHSKQQNARGVTSWTPFPTHPAKWGVTPFTTSAWRAMFSRHGLQMPSHFFVRDGTLITTQLSGRPSSEESTGSSSAGPRQPHRVTTCSTAVNSSTSNVLARIASSRHDTLDDLDASNTAPVRTPPGPEKANLVKTSKVDRMSDAVFGRAALDPAVANETLAEIKKEVAMYQQALAPLLLQQKKYEHLVQMHSAQGSQ